MNNNPTLSIAGVWQPIDESYLSEDNSGSFVPLSGLVKLNGSDEYSIILNSWGWNGSFGADKPHQKIDIALLSPDESGNFQINTSNYINDATTNGGNSVVIADFNEDGKDDIFLAAHCESPFIAMNSTAYLSNPSGIYTKVTLDDQVMAHDAQLAYINGKPSIVTSTFLPGDSHNIYQYSNGNFIATETNPSWDVTGMSSILQDFDNDGTLELVKGSVMTLSEWIDEETDRYIDSSLINVYSFDDTNMDLESMTPIQSIIPYLSELEEYKNYESMYGTGITHTPRLWTDDLNNDGNLDILASLSMFSMNDANGYPTALQVLINNDNGTFKDMTATLNPSMDYNQDELDYNPSFIDIDGSGINTYCFSSFGDSFDRLSNYVLLNDGTGHLYTAVHDKFAQLAQRVIDYLEEQYPNLYVNDTINPKFIAVPQSNGSINFVAEVAAGSWTDNTNTIWSTQHVLVNIPFQYNPTTDFTDDVVVTDRNDSTLMRTWAGNDTFTNTNANSSPTHIDGGLGIDTSSYNMSSFSLTITSNEDGVINVSGKGIEDTLVNVERIKTTDQSLAFDLEGTAGNAYRIYQAAFDRTPDLEGLGYWIREMDRGMSLQDVSNSFIESAEFISLYGENTSNDDFLTLLYNNVLHRDPDVSGYAYWMNEFNAGIISQTGALASFSESVENKANVEDAIATGIEYIVYGSLIV